MKEYKYKIDGKKYNVAIGEIADNNVDVTVNGEVFNVEVEAEKVEEKKKVVVSAATKPSTDDTEPNSNVNTNNAVKSPLPGVITEIKVSVGDNVSVGDTLVVLEAMKMANNIEAEQTGTVKAVLVKQGESVMEDTPLVVVE